MSSHPDPNPPAMLRLLHQVEANHHRVGWDNSPASLYVLYDWRHSVSDQMYRGLLRRYGPGVRVGEYAAQPMLQLGDGGYPARALTGLAMKMTDSTLVAGGGGRDVLLMLLGLPGFLGLAFCAEAYGSDQITVEQYQELPQPLADTPGLGTYEVRLVCGHDRADTRYAVDRRRGAKPTGSYLRAVGAGGAGRWAEMDGAVHEALHIITAVATGAPLPDAQWSPR